MRKWAVFLLLAVTAWPAMAAKTVTVGQVEDLLYKLHGKSDGKVAQELSDLELTERVSPARLAKWEKDFPGNKTHEALIKLTDLAAFLNPPAEDVVPIPGPDSATQERMLTMAAGYVKTTITRLPNLIATRETTHFEDTPSTETPAVSGPTMSGGRQSRSMGTVGAAVGRALGPSMSSSEYKSLRSTGTSSSTVTYRDGHEVSDTDSDKGRKQSAPTNGFTTVGEFGPILSVVMGDVLRSEATTWQRWEQGGSEPVAVFRYAVAADQSNYMVGFPSAGKVDEIYPAYHGEIAIDPATGTILRISVVSELPAPYQTMQTAILVEYAPVTIGEQSYFCPARGVAFYKAAVGGDAAAHERPAVSVQTQLNDVAFTQYHLFRSKARIVTGDSGQSDAPAEAPAAPAGATHQP